MICNELSWGMVEVISIIFGPVLDAGFIFSSSERGEGEEGFIEIIQIFHNLKFLIPGVFLLLQYVV